MKHTITFNGWLRPSKHRMRVVYISDLDKLTVKRLAELLNDPPDLVIFTGDIIFSVKYNTLKYWFYRVMKIAQRHFGFSDTECPDWEETKLCDASVADPGDEREISFRERWLDLQRFICELTGKPFDASDYTDEEIAADIRKTTCVKNVYYGPWLWKLFDLCTAAVADFKEQADETIAAMKKLIEAGCRVVVCGGNDDNIPRTHAGFIEKGGRVHDSIEDVIEAGVEFCADYTAIDTPNAVFLLMPYWAIHAHGVKEQQDLEKAIDTAQAGYKDGKAIIIVAHVEFAWPPHNQTTNDPWQQPRDDRLYVMLNHQRAVAHVYNRLGPASISEGIYGTKEGRMQNAHGEVQFLEVKYAVEVINGSEVVLVPNQEFGRPGQFPVTALNQGFRARSFFRHNGVPQTEFHDPLHGRDMAEVY